MSTIQIHGFAASTYTTTALVVAAEAGVDAELVPLQFKTPSHLALHPHGKMPVLRHGSFTVFETLAIVAYVDRVFGEGRLHPSKPAEYARMLQWSSAAIDYVYDALVGALHEDRLASSAVAAAGQQLKLLEAGMSDAPYFAGKRESLADFMLYPMVQFARAKLGAAIVSELPALRRWTARMAERPAVVQVTHP